MSRLIDLTGQRFGRLTVVKRMDDGIRPNGTKYVRWLCKCDCSNEVIVDGNSLKRQHTTSCGCYLRERSTQVHTTHGQRHSRLYTIWRTMKLRCSNPKTNGYKDYGGKGVTVCEEWQDFDAFFDWAMQNGYSDSLTIDRKDRNGNYEPSNCKWATQKEQQNNKSTNHLLTYNGETKTMTQWADEYRMNFHTLKERIKRGWTVEKALTTPVKKHKHKQK